MDHCRYLRFSYHGNLYEFRCLPFGLSSAPRAFTKILKPVVVLICSLGIRIVIYLDDILLLHQKKNDLVQIFYQVDNLLQNLGFTIKPDTATGIPGGSAGHNEDDNLTSTREVGVNHPRSPPNPTDQSNIFREAIITYWQNESCCSDWGLESTLILSQPTARPGNIYSPIWQASKRFQVTLSQASMTELIWWSSPHLHTFNGQPLRPVPFDLTISTDASLLGWGATWNGVTTGGRWLPQEGKSHINWLELKAAYPGLQALFNSQTSIPNHIL
ncbi:Hypothetical predicted protein [Paramuricea clavata]|uniref:Uncharacterized protein n=1 Tax=Paramuricea clavata TaxID=317549 RepID=A0A6S7LJZ3_PARCT|nr:Hypothetical predicted protein [Paramuricea clavata]